MFINLTLRPAPPATSQTDSIAKRQSWMHWRYIIIYIIMLFSKSVARTRVHVALTALEP